MLNESVTIMNERLPRDDGSVLCLDPKREPPKPPLPGRAEHTRDVDADGDGTNEFVIHWRDQDFGSPVEETTIVGYVADAAERSWNTICGPGGWGFDEPPDSDVVDIYIWDNQNTWGPAQSQWPGPYYTHIGSDQYIYVNNNFVAWADAEFDYEWPQPSEAYLAALCHEFFHAIQRRYDLLAETKKWVFEGQARYVESAVNPTGSFYVGQSANLRSSYIGQALEYFQSCDSFLGTQSYNACVFWRFIHERHGGTGLILAICDQIEGDQPGAQFDDEIASLDAIFGGLNPPTSVEDVFLAFACANYEPKNLYEHGECYYDDVPIAEQYSSYPVNNAPINVDARFATKYVEFTPENTTDEWTLTIEVDGPDDADLRAARAALVLVAPSGFATPVAITLDEQGEGSQIVSPFGDGLIEKVILVLCNTSRTSNTADFTYSATLEGGGNVDVVEIIDRSGSMSGSKIAAAKVAAKIFVGMMQLGDKIGVVSYECSSSVDFALAEIIGDDTKNDAKDAIDALVTGGRTSIGAGLQAAWGQLQGHAADPVRAMILMSDGKQNCGQTPGQVLPLIDDDVLIYTVGFGSDVDATLMSSIADDGNGNYYFAPGEDELQEIYFVIGGRIRGEQLILSETGVATSGRSQTGHTVLLDGSVLEARVGLDWSGSDLDLGLVNPYGEVINHFNVDDYPDISLEVGDTHEVYTLHDPVTGQWELLVDAVDVPPGGEPYRVYALVRTLIRMELTTDHNIYVAGDPIEMAVSLSDVAPIPGSDVRVFVTRPGESIPYMITCYDDGAHNDGASDDGVYGGTFTVTAVPGSYRLEAHADGVSNEGIHFQRIIWHSVVVNSGTDPDGDGMPTDWELTHGLNPNVHDAAGDPDGDQLPNITEYENGTDPQNADTDDDGWTDAEELVADSDPLDPNSVPMMDANGDVDIEFANLRWDRRTRHSTCTVTVTNHSAVALGPDLHFVMGDVDPPNVTVGEVDGVNPIGLPYVDLGALLGTQLEPGESITAILDFHNPEAAHFTFAYGVWATAASTRHRGTSASVSYLGPFWLEKLDGDHLGYPSDFSEQKQARLEAIVEGTDNLIE